MKRFSLILFLTLSFLAFPVLLAAQEPDPIPIPSLPEEEKDSLPIIDIATFDNVIPEEDEKDFIFCGQNINLNSRERRKKLRTEIALIARSSSTLLQRSNYYFPIIEPILKQFNIPDDFKYLMVIESFMNPNARSIAGAAGIWQFMPGTASDYGLVVNSEVDERYHLGKATSAACRYLNDAYQRFGDWVAVAQSYNIGQTRIKNELAAQKVEEALDLDLVEETNRYVYRIFAAKIIFTKPENFGVNRNILYYKKIRQPAIQRY